MSPSPLDRSPVTDGELLMAVRTAASALAIVEALLDIASPRQVQAVLGASPWDDQGSVAADMHAWVSVVLDGTTGLHSCDRAPGAA